MCETRWTEKYESIKRFNQNFNEIADGLEKLSSEGNQATRNAAYQLHSSITKPSFLIALKLIAKYSALLEPIVNVLQSKSMDMLKMSNHIKAILEVVSENRQEIDELCNEILQEARETAEYFSISLSAPRKAGKQIHRANHPAENDEEYWRRSLIIPYLDSLLSSLRVRFSEEHNQTFALSALMPHNLMNMVKELKFKFKEVSVSEFYHLENINAELDVWYNLWKNKKLTKTELMKMDIIDVLLETDQFFPDIRKSLLILITIPPTTANIERSFSTLRRVKTWLRSTMTERRLSGK